MRDILEQWKVLEIHAEQQEAGSDLESVTEKTRSTPSGGSSSRFN